MRSQLLPAMAVAEELVIANELQILFVINNPEVYKSPNSNTYM